MRRYSNSNPWFNWTIAVCISLALLTLLLATSLLLWQATHGSIHALLGLIGLAVIAFVAVMGIRWDIKNQQRLAAFRAGDDSAIMHLSKGRVYCMHPRCDWFMETSDETRLKAAFAQHVIDAHHKATTTTRR